MLPSINQPRIWKNGFKLEHAKQYMEINMVTSNVTYLYLRIYILEYYRYNRHIRNKSSRITRNQVDERRTTKN